jgi:hypothetical protein
MMKLTFSLHVHPAAQAASCASVEWSLTLIDLRWRCWMQRLGGLRGEPRGERSDSRLGSCE